VRASSRRDNLEGIDADIVPADMRDRAAMTAADARRADTCFIAAADYRLWARDPGEIVRNNLEGTRGGDAGRRRPQASSASSTPAAWRR